MKHLKILILLQGLILACALKAEVLWVGDSAQCNQPSHYATLNLALLRAIVNGSQSDEIRLTNTVNYTGEVNGDYILTNWNSGGNGQLTLVGGYNDCNGSISGRTVIGDNTKDIFDVSSNSTVIMKNLEITLGEKRGIKILGNSSVHLENVNVTSNLAGIEVGAGSFLEANSSTLIQEHLDEANNPKGGGILCYGANSEVSFAGKLIRNAANRGGNMFIEDGCFVELLGGAEVRGAGFFTAASGAGIFVDDGGELLASGGASRVAITDNVAVYGGGIYVWGTGKATLLNTFIARNYAHEKGSGLYAINGGTSSTQVFMDRAASCPFIISCSEFDSNSYPHSVVYVDNSLVQINRTLFEGNVFNPFDNVVKGLVHTTASGKTRLSHINMLNNGAFHLFLNEGETEVAHLTAIGNSYDDDDIGAGDSWAWVNLGILRLENSIWQDTQGGDHRGGAGDFVTGKCNLIDVIGDWPGGTYTVGFADFINPAGGDSRQISSSDGVDMCTEDTFAWNTNRDIEYQVSPVNENTNPQGMPGETGGLYDAGFDEVYDNIGEDEFLLTVQREGSGEGFVISDPLGISCGSDCSEVVFNGTLVTLTATPIGNSEFTQWSGCPLPNGNECLISVTESTTVYAEFQPDDLIFEDGFD